VKIKKPGIACAVCMVILAVCAGIDLFIFEPLGVRILSVPGLCLITTSVVSGLAMIWFAARADAEIGRKTKIEH